MSETLRACPTPWCKHANRPPVLNGEMCKWVECPMCGVGGPIRDTKAKAIAAWNTRPTDTDEALKIDLAVFQEACEQRGQYMAERDIERLAHIETKKILTAADTDEALRAALEALNNYGCHSVSCANAGPDVPCHCGLEAAIAGAKEATTCRPPTGLGTQETLQADTSPTPILGEDQ